MLKRSHFVPLLLATSPLVVVTSSTTAAAVDTTPPEEEAHHLRHHYLAPTPPQLMPRRNGDGMRNNQSAHNNNQLERKEQQQIFSKSSKSKTHKAKSAKDSKDGYHHYGNVFDADDDGLVVSGDYIQHGLTNDDDDDDDDEDGGQDDSDQDSEAPLLQVSFDILPPNTNSKEDSSSMTTEDGDAIEGMGSEAVAFGFSSYGRNDTDIDRNNTEGSGFESTLATSSTEQVAPTTSTESIDGELPTTTSAEAFDRDFPLPPPTTTTTNSTNVEVREKRKLNPTGRTAVGIISLVSCGSILCVSAGLYIHKRQSERAAALAAGAAANDNNSEEDASVDASSIWSANEVDDIAGGGGPAMPMSSPRSAGVSSIAAMGMASPLALQLSADGGTP